MKQVNWKKILLPNIPYVVIALFATKLGQAARLATGANFAEKFLHFLEGLSDAFAIPLPSFHPVDLCVGIAIAAAMRLGVYVKGKNAKKSARTWNTVPPGGVQQRILSPLLTRCLKTTSSSPRLRA